MSPHPEPHFKISCCSTRRILLWACLEDWRNTLDQPFSDTPTALQREVIGRCAGPLEAVVRAATGHAVQLDYAADALTVRPPAWAVRASAYEEAMRIACSTGTP